MTKTIKQVQGKIHQVQGVMRDNIRQVYANVADMERVKKGSSEILSLGKQFAGKAKQLRGSGFKDWLKQSYQSVKKSLIPKINHKIMNDTDIMQMSHHYRHGALEPDAPIHINQERLHNTPAEEWAPELMENKYMKSIKYKGGNQQRLEALYEDLEKLPENSEAWDMAYNSLEGELGRPVSINKNANEVMGELRSAGQHDAAEFLDGKLAGRKTVFPRDIKSLHKQFPKRNFYKLDGINREMHLMGDPKSFGYMGAKTRQSVVPGIKYGVRKFAQKQIGEFGRHMGEEILTGGLNRTSLAKGAAKYSMGKFASPESQLAYDLGGNYAKEWAAKEGIIAPRFKKPDVSKGIEDSLREGYVDAKNYVFDKMEGTNVYNKVTGRNHKDFIKKNNWDFLESNYKNHVLKEAPPQSVKRFMADKEGHIRDWLHDPHTHRVKMRMNQKLPKMRRINFEKAGIDDSRVSDFLAKIGHENNYKTVGETIDHAMRRPTTTFNRIKQAHPDLQIESAEEFGNRMMGLSKRNPNLELPHESVVMDGGDVAVRNDWFNAAQEHGVNNLNNEEINLDEFFDAKSQVSEAPNEQPFNFEGDEFFDAVGEKPFNFEGDEFFDAPAAVENPKSLKGPRAGGLYKELKEAQLAAEKPVPKIRRAYGGAKAAEGVGAEARVAEGVGAEARVASRGANIAAKQTALSKAARAGGKVASTAGELLMLLDVEQKLTMAARIYREDIEKNQKKYGNLAGFFAGLGEGTVDNLEGLAHYGAKMIDGIVDTAHLIAEPAVTALSDMISKREQSEILANSWKGEYFDRALTDYGFDDPWAERVEDNHSMNPFDTENGMFSAKGEVGSWVNQGANNLEYTFTGHSGSGGAELTREEAMAKRRRELGLDGDDTIATNPDSSFSADANYQFFQNHQSHQNYQISDFDNNTNFGAGFGNADGNNLAQRLRNPNNNSNIKVTNNRNSAKDYAF